MNILGSSTELGRQQRQMQKFRTGEVTGGRRKKGLFGEINRLLERGRTHEALRDGNQGPTFFSGERIF